MARQTNNPDDLFARVATILEEARGAVARTINTAMVQAYWHVGREIMEVEQAGEHRADYGDEVIKKLSRQLVGTFGKGFSAGNLKRMRQFFRVFPVGSTIGSTVEPIYRDRLDGVEPIVG